MSYKALLFCPDEATARLVTQVLSELDFTVELSFEPFVTVKKLEQEPFDALVVDCTNEQNASVLFKGARGSTLNHSSLCVAVAEGQAGLANAFRIGANLVLTKPINIEQSKNTLRVARGLLRKNAPASGSRPTTNAESRPASAPAIGAQPASAPPAPARPSAPPTPAVPAISAPTPAPSMPSSLLEAEQKKTASGPSTPTSSMFASAPAPATPSVASTHSSGGFGAAPAMAPEKREAPTSPVESRPKPELRSTSPLVTHEPIVPDTRFQERPAPAVPTFSSYATRPAAKSGASKAMWIIPCVLLVGAAGFFAWKKYQPMQYIHVHIGASNVAPATEPASAVPDNKTPAAVDVTSEQSNPTSQVSQPTATSGSVSSATGTPASSASGAEGFPTKEHIEISAPAEAEPERPVAVAPKPQPLRVSSKGSPAPVTHEQPAPAPAPPALVIAGTNPADSTIAGLVKTNATMPKASTSTLRISQGITQGLLIKRVPPTYPPSALQLRREGTVELLATISKSGAITTVKVLSGDGTLAKAATDAVKQWKYRPYLLNGEPVEIETQISMIFRLPH